MTFLKNTKLILLVILAVAAVLRIYNLNSLPPSLNWDEISHGYNAYSVFRTGSDEWGQRFPIANFRAYGDYPLPLNLYLTIPFVALLGLTEVSIRFPHALLGVLTVGAVYFLVEAVTKKKQMALFASFLAAITPWYVFTSRFVLQSNLAVFFLTSGMALFFNKSKHKSFLPLSIIFLGLTLFSYHSTRIFTPLLIVPLLILYRKTIITKVNVVLFLLFFLPLPFILLNPTARARSSEVFLLNPNVVYSIEVARNTSSLSPTLQKLVYNRPVYLASHFASNYVKYFSPQFLFLKGGTQYQFSIPNHGLLYVTELPFFYLGIIALLYYSLRKRNKEYSVLLMWLLLSPIPASMTTEQFAVVRSTTMLPIPEILVTLGIFEASSFLKKKFNLNVQLLFISFITLTVICLGYYLYSYSGSYAKDYSWAWQYGYKDAVLYAKDHYNSYDKIIMTKKYGEPHEYVLFFNQWNPAKYKADSSLNRFTQSNWWWVDGFDKYVFVNDWQIPHEGNVFVTESKRLTDCAKIRCLLITSPDNSPKNWRKLSTINFLDNKKAFELYEN